MMNRLLPLILIFAACDSGEAPGHQFYDQHIQPIFNNFCVGNTSPCHKNAGDGTALGNLDLSSFDGVQKRRDALRTYGSYPQPLLLLKSVPEAQTQMPYRGTLILSEIRHAGGKPISTDSDAYFELKRWLDNGATADGLPPPVQANQGAGSCHTDIPPGIDTSTVDTNSQQYQDFVNNVQPILESSCAYGTCHSSPQSDFYITCGSDDNQKKYNFLTAAGFVAPMGTAVEQSEILLRPLAPQAGGVSHTGGIFFQSRDDSGWKTIRDWASLVQQNPPPLFQKSTGETFFEANVMPVLLKRGCVLEGCHSPDGFNDYRLRPGAQGFFSPLALKRNYEATLQEFLALDTPDITQSRAVKKPILVDDGGIVHRGGAVLETPGHTITEPCPSPYDPATATAFCTIKEWHRLERIDHSANVSPLGQGDTVLMAYISRPPNNDALVEFDTFQGGADLILADATIGQNGRVDSVSNPRSALGGCGIAAGADVRGPEWSYDGSKLIFAARPSASGGFDLYELTIGGACTQLTHDGGTMVNGVRVHNFDPVYAPDGTIVFASTRAGSLTLKRLLPNSNLYRVKPGGDFTMPEQVTWLLNSELSPAFMQDGRLTFTAEKATPDFYQLSGRRINWDLTDYHPLLAQRRQSDDTFGTMHDSIGYEQATEIREGLDRNFIIILSNRTNKGAGGDLATFNRSVGPFEMGRSDTTYVKSVVIFDAGGGQYRSPFSLPNGEILASWASDPNAPRYDLVAVDDHTGARRTLVSGGGQSLVEATLGYKRAETELFQNLPQLVFGGHGGFVSGTPADRAIMHFPDLPMLSTLLNFNLRRGRNVAKFDAIAQLKVYIENPPGNPPDMSKMTGPEMVYVDRTAVGQAGLESDHSLKVDLPSQKPLILELLDGNGGVLFTMREEHQLGPGENISPGVPRKLFNGVCGGCHGSISGEELDIAVTPDSLTGASVSASRDADPKHL